MKDGSLLFLGLAGALLLRRQRSKRNIKGSVMRPNGPVAGLRIDAKAVGAEDFSAVTVTNELGKFVLSLDEMRDVHGRKLSTTHEIILGVHDDEGELATSSAINLALLEAEDAELVLSLDRTADEALSIEDAAAARQGA